MRSTRLCSLAILAALLFTSFKSVSVATQAVTSTQNPLDQLRDTVKGFLDSAGLPFTTDQDRAIALMMEDRRRASEELFGQMMDFRAGPVQGQEMDRAVAAIRWMYDEFKKQLRAYLTPEQLVVWDKYQSQGGIGALKRILSEAGNPLTAENERRAELLYSNLSADSETSAYSSIEDILSPEQRGAVVQANQRAAPSNGSGTRQAADGQAVAVALRELTRPVRGLTPVLEGVTRRENQAGQQTQFIRINNNGFTSEYSGYLGSAAGGSAEVIQRGGVGAFHGNMAFEFKDEALNARNPFANNKPPYQVRQTNGNFSGPVIRNRLSMNVFVSHNVQQEADTVNATTPTGRFQLGFTRPLTTRNVGGGATYQLTDVHSLTFSAANNGLSAEKQNMGGFSLPEREVLLRDGSTYFQVRQFSAFSERTIYESRFSTTSFYNRGTSVTQGVSIVVLDAFTGGGGPTNNDSTGRNNEFGTLFTRMGTNLTIKSGFEGIHRSVASSRKDNFQGTFTFSSLADYQAGRPATYRGAQGDPLLEATQFETGYFMQNDIRVTRRLTVMAGARYEHQTNLQDVNNIAPRLGVAYALGRSTVVRTGAGVFFQRFPFGAFQHQSRLDGIRRSEQSISNPSYPDPFQSGSVVPSTIRVNDPDMAAPYNVIATISAEHNFPRNLFVSAAYELNRGIHQLRSRNRNAPLPACTALLGPTPSNAAINACKPDPSRGQIQNMESTGSFRSHTMRLSFRQRFSIFNVNASYAYASSYGDNDGAFSFPSNNYELHADWSRTPQPAHQISSAINARLPLGVFLTGSLSANDGPPYNITTGKDNNFDTNFSDRPQGLCAKHRRQSPISRSELQHFESGSFSGRMAARETARPTSTSSPT